MRGGFVIGQRAARYLGALVVLGLCLSTARAQDKEAEKDADYYELMKVFVDTFEQIDRNYVTDVDRRELMEAAVQGMLTKLDPYSNYIPPAELAKFNQAVEQEFGGIGIQVQLDPETKRLTVITPLPGTPAYKAGVKAGDVIMEIEGESTEGFTIDDAVEKLKGKPGEEVSIGVTHLGEEKVETLKMERAIIQVSTVLGDHYKGADEWDYMLDPKEKIGYVRLTHFSRRTADELLDALQDLEKRGMKGLVIDLRFNPGGLLDQAVRIVDLFLEEGRIVSTKGRNTPERAWEAHDEPGTFEEFPVAVLVNRYSASASEIVSAALQDHKRAYVVGERTWGKGSVQNVIELEGGSSALKLTTANYYRPSGKNIHRSEESEKSGEWGVMPDEVVKLSTQEMREYLDYRRDRDVIDADGPPESDFKDRQLAKALEYLKKQINGEGESKEKDKPKAADAEKPADAEAAGKKEAAELPRQPLPKVVAA